MKVQIARGTYDEGRVEYLKIADDDKQLIFIEESEFYYQGRIYDVISQRTEKDFIYISCICDHEENNLIQNYNTDTEDNQAENKSNNLTQILKNFVTDFNYSFQEYCLNNQNSKKTYNTFKSQLYSGQFKNPDSPPPKS